MGRITITNQRKLAILRDADTRMADGESLKSVARSHGVQPVQIRSWRKIRGKISVARGKARSVSKGRPSSIKHLEEQVIGWALELRHAGVGLSYRHLQVQACRFDPEFAARTDSQQYQLIRRLCAANCLVRRRKTHVAQEHPQVSWDKAKEWILDVRAIVSAPTVNKQYVINMDQTPLPFSMASSSTLNLAGESTITVRQTGNAKTRCTVSLSICCDGSKLKPMVIFKGERNGRIATREFPTFPTRDNLVLAAQANAWQDEENMKVWVDKVLVPHIQQRAAGTPVLLFLDQFSAHQTGPFRARMEALGVELRLIPGGCTWLVQPIDVGIGKPFKDRMREKWWNWMIGPAADDALITTPSREMVSKWVHETWDDMPPEIIKNSWRRTDLHWVLDN